MGKLVVVLIVGLGTLGCTSGGSDDDPKGTAGEGAAAGSGGTGGSGGSGDSGGSGGSADTGGNGGTPGSGGRSAGSAGTPSSTGGSGGDGGTGGAGAAAGAGGSGGAEPPLARMLTERTSPVTGDLESLATSGDVIVAAGEGQLIYSEDGIEWALPEPPVLAQSVAYGGGIFSAVGEDGHVYSSSDGKTWEERSLSGVTADFRSVTYAFDKFFRVSFSVSGGGFSVSIDGITWTAGEAKFSDPSYRPDWSNTNTTGSAGNFVYVSTLWSTPGHNFGSTDGVNWDIIDDWTSLTYDVTFDGTTYCSVGAYSGGASTDLENWTTSGAGLLGVTNWEGVFYAVGGFGAVRASRDCVEWEAGADPALPEYLPNSLQAGLRAIRVHQERLVVVGYGGKIYTSP